MSDSIHGARNLILGGLLLLGSMPSMQSLAQEATPRETPAQEASSREAGAQTTETTGTAAKGEIEGRAPAVDLPNARYSIPGVLTGGQPTREQLAEAADAGYRTVVNLRGEKETAGGEEAAEVEKLGMRYVALPIAGSEDLTGENAQVLADLLAKEDAYPILLHCGSGNRVGALVALQAAYYGGKDSDEALAMGLEAGLTTLEPTIRNLLGLRADIQE